MLTTLVENVVLGKPRSKRSIPIALRGDRGDRRVAAGFG
jgi:hypothetical protein